MGRVTFDRRVTVRRLRHLTGHADQMNPAALLVLVLALVTLVHFAAPFAVMLFTSLVTVVKAAVFLAGAGILARLATRSAASYRRASTSTGHTA